MKKLLLLILAIYLYGCDKIPDGTIEPQNSEYQVNSITAVSEIVYPFNSSFITTVKINNPSAVNAVWLNLIDPAEKQLNAAPVILNDNGNTGIGDQIAGDGIYSTKITLSNTNINGRYRIQYFIKDKFGEVKSFGQHYFNYDNGQVKYPPFLSDLVMPDTVLAGPDNKFIITIKVSDENGLTDVENVFFKSIHLEDSTESPYEAMRDDGNLDFGDNKANDGTYSYKSYFLPETKGKSRQFVFQAIDRSDSLSNIITHTIYIK